MEVVPPPGIGRFFFLSAMATLFGTTKQKYIACEDIGKAVATALLSDGHGKYNEKILTIAGHVANVDELQAALEKGEGKTSWGRMWLPRFLIIRLTPYHYKQMFEVSTLLIADMVPRADFSSGYSTTTASREASKRRASWFRASCRLKHGQEDNGLIGSLLNVEDCTQCLDKHHSNMCLPSFYGTHVPFAG